MAWAWAYLGVSVFGALLVGNAFRPSRRPMMAVPSFFAGWYTNEMAVWHIIWQVAATVVFGLEGALHSWPGWVGLAINAVAWTGLVRLARIADQSRLIFDRVAQEVALGIADDVVLPRHGGETMWRYPRLLYPLPRPARSVSVLKNLDYFGDGARCAPPRHHPPAGGPAHRGPRSRLHPRGCMGHRGQARAGPPDVERVRPPRVGVRDHQLSIESQGDVAGSHRRLQAAPSFGSRTTSPTTAETPASSPSAGDRPAGICPLFLP